MIYDAVIIGSGPGGMTAAMYLKRANLNVLLIEKEAPGGQIIKTGYVENYPGVEKVTGVELATRMYMQIVELNVPNVFENVISVEKNEYFEITTENNKYYAKNVIAATGTKQRQLGIPNENKLYTRGISYCAICDGSFYKDEDVLVIGGGNSAFEEGLYLSNICKSVTLIARANFRATDIYIEKALNTPNMKICKNTKPLEFIGEKHLEKVRCQNTLTNEIFDIEVKGAFIYIGSEPNTSLFKHFNVLNENGYIITNEHKETTIKGLYAVGDCSNQVLKQIVTATSDGAVAATSISKNI